MKHEDEGFGQHGYCDSLQMSIVYQGEEWLVGCPGGGKLQQLLVGSHRIGQMPWDGGDGQKRGVAYALEGFSPSYDDYDAGGGWGRAHPHDKCSW